MNEKDDAPYDSSDENSSWGEEQGENREAESLDLFINNEEKFTRLQKNLGELLKEFNLLAREVYGIYSDTSKNSLQNISKNPYSGYTDQFLNWRKKFEAAVKQAEELGVIGKEFSNKYKNYTTEQWNQDPLWQQIKPLYKTIDKNRLNIGKLEPLIKEIEASHAERSKNYKKAGTHPAGIATLGIFPLLVLVIYAVDLAISTIRLEINKYEQRSSEKEKTKAKDALEEISPIKRTVHYQAAIGARPFFQELKKAAEKAEKEQDPSPDSDSNDSSQPPSPGSGG